MNKISIVIPILNEAENITNLLNHLIKNSTKKNISEIIIVDGASVDGSQHIVEDYIIKNNFKILLSHSHKGRAKQMNLGVNYATGNILYFLHADSFPPVNFDKHILNEIEKENAAGCFRMKFNSSHLWLKLAGWLTQLPFKCCRGGDQSLFVTKSIFNKIGGFDENFVIYEDNDFISKLYKLNQFVVIQKWLVTSPRCYSKNGIWKLQWHYWTIHLKKFFGASSQELNQYYKKYIC